MAIIAAGIRYDQNKVIQAVVVVTDEDGAGHPDHLNPHKLHAAKLGHGWLNIQTDVYRTFRHRQDLEEHFAKVVK